MYGNRVKESSTTTGVGNITLAGAATGFVSFNAAFSTNQPFHYFVLHDSNNTWEQGIGYLSAATTLVRKTVLDNSSGTQAAINFAAGGLTVVASPSAGSLLDVPAYPFNHPDSGQVLANEQYDYSDFVVFPLVADRHHLSVFVTSVGMVVDQGHVEVTVADAASSIKFGMYRLNQSGDAASLVAACKTAVADSSTTGFKTVALDGGSVYIPPGQYLTAAVSNGTPTVRCHNATDCRGHWFGLGTNQIIPARGLYASTGSYAAGLPEPLGLTLASSSSQHGPAIAFSKA